MRISNTLLFLFFSLAFCPQGRAQSNVNDSLLHNGLQRKYTVHLPPAYNPAARVPLVVFLHGGGGSAASAQGFTQFNLISNQEKFLVAYPQAFAALPTGGFAWADGRGTAADLMGIDDAGFINDLLDKLTQDYGIDTSRIYLCGFSNGGFMTQRIACERNEKIAALGLLGSTMDVFVADTCQPGRSIPALIITGTADPFVPYGGGAMQGNVPNIISSADFFYFWVDNNHCSIPLDSLNFPDTDTSDHSTVTRFAYTGCDCDAQVWHFRVNNGGHTWPGVELPNLELIAGETNEDIQAAFQLWLFFRQFSLCTETVAAEEKKNTASKAMLVLFPQPANSLVFVKSNEQLTSLALTSSAGNLIREIQVLRTEWNLNISDLPPGVYVLQARFADGSIAARKLLKVAN